MDISETIAVYDVKIGRCSYLNEYMNKGQGHSLTLVQGHSDSTFANFFPEKPLGRLKPKLTWSLNGMGERKFIQMVQVA